MIIKLKREGAGWVIPLDAALLERLGFDEQTELEVSTTGSSLVLSVNDPERRKLFDEALAETNQQFGRALQRLAE
jgi:antitoxin component of MazEF toxin-antitoxin module